MTRDLTHFIFLTFAVSWTAGIVAALVEPVRPFALIAGTCGPTVTALILVRNRPVERHGILARLVQWRCPLWTYVYALALPILGIATALAITRWVTVSGSVSPAAMPAYIPVLVFAYVLFLSVAGEELG